MSLAWISRAGPAERSALRWSCLIFLLCDLVLLLPGWWEFGLDAVVGSFERDMGLQFYPWRDYAREALLSGRLPEWNPHLFAGAPFLAAQQSAPFYPLGWPLLLFPVALGVCLQRLLHLLILQVGAWLLARQAGAGPRGALLAGVVCAFASSSTYVIFAGGACALDGGAWVPWVLLAAWRALRGEVLEGVVLGTLFSSLQILAGYPQMAQLTWFGLLPWLVGMSWSEGLSPRQSALRLAPFVLGVPLLTGVVSAAALVPAIELTSRSARRGFDPAWVSMLSMPPRQFLTLLAPDLFGATWAESGFWGEGYPWNTTIHLGVGALVLAGFGLRGRPGLAWGLPCAFLGLVSLGGHNPLFLPLAELLPGAGMFRGPSKHLVVVAPFASVLVALGLGRVRRGLSGAERRFAAGLLAAALLLLLACAATSDAPAWFAEWATGVATEGEHFYPVEADAGFVESAWEGAQSSLLLGLLWGGAALLTALLSGRLGRRRTSGVLVSLVLVELLVYGCGHVAFFSAERYPLPADLRMALRSESPRRVALLGGEEINRPMVARLESLSGYEAVLPARTNAFYNAWEGTEGQRYFRFVNRVDGVTRLLGQEVIVTPAGVYPGFAREVDPPLQHAARLSEHDLWLDPGALPRAFLVGPSRTVVDRDALLAEVVAPGFDPRAEVLLETPSRADWGGPTLGPDGQARVVSHRPEQVTVEVSAPHGAYLVLADAYDEGWSATVNGEPAPVLPAYGLIRAVPVSAGRSQVVFRYRSPARLGIALSLLGLLGLLGGAWGLRRYSMSKNQPPSS